MVEIPTRYKCTNDYAASREALVKAEHEASFDYLAAKSASPAEKEANVVLKMLIRAESETIYGIRNDGSGHEPAHQFRRAKHLIDSSKIFQIAKSAPKGALLHCHFDAMLPPSELISTAKGMKNMHISTDAALTKPGFFEHTIPSFQILSKEKAETYSSTDIFSVTYVPGDWMLFSDFRKSFPGGEVKADKWVEAKIVLDPEDIYNSSQTVNGLVYNLKIGSLTNQRVIGFGNHLFAPSKFFRVSSVTRPHGARTSGVLFGILLAMVSTMQRSDSVLTIKTSSTAMMAKRGLTIMVP